MSNAEEMNEGHVHDQKLNHVPSGDEIVISGVAGRFPESNNVHELQENLMSKRDLVTEDDRRWKLDHHPDTPRRSGKISNIEKFDATFFGVHSKQAEATVPVGRVILEHAFEAILDAGVNPRQLRGSRTGVFVGASGFDFKPSDKSMENGWGIIGNIPALLSNCISYGLDLTGPSYTVDTGCSASMHALAQAYQAMRDDLCDAAIVASGNLCMQSSTTLQLSKMDLLASDGRCKAFDEAADGFVRSEAACVIFLQKATHAKRVYATLIHSKTNNDGFKSEGLSCTSRRAMKSLIETVCRESGVPTTCVSYVEAHGTGTKVGDPEEISAFDQALCRGRPRDSPLLVGSAKTNLGHTEAASGIVSVIKVVRAMETGLIPPNLHFHRCNPELTAILEGRIKVVDELTPWTGGYAGVNSCGIGGSNGHALLRSNAKEKLNDGAPTDDLPRLVAVSGRTEEAVAHIFDYLEGRAVDAEFVALLHNIHSCEISGHLFRGYTVLPPRGVAKTPSRAIEEAPAVRRPVWFVFSGMGSQWPGMGEALMRIPAFARAIARCDAALKPLGIDVQHVITNKDKATFDVILNAFVGITAVQIGLVDVLRSLGIEPDHIIGHSFGELACAYADGCMTAEQTILASYYRGLVSIQTTVIRGSMAVVGLGYQQLRAICPVDIEVACHNSADNATLSGPADSMQNFLKELKAKDIFVQEVVVSNIAYHSRYIEPFRAKFLAYLRQVIPDAKPRSSKWMSTSVPMDQWDSELARYSSAEYHTNNFLSHVLFEEVSAQIPKDAIAIEIAPHGLFQSILRKSLQPGVSNIPLALRGHQDNMQVLLQSIGKMFNAGLHPQISNLYPAVEFPVSRSTPMISPLIKWEHSEDWFVTSYDPDRKRSSGERVVKISVSDSEYESLADHVVDGQNSFPATGYLTLIWETLAMMQGNTYTNLSVVFEDVKFFKTVILPKEGSLELTCMIHKGTGKFEIDEGGVVLVTGFVRSTDNPAEERSSPDSTAHQEEEVMTSEDIHKEMRIRGYHYKGTFRGVTRASTTGSRGHIAWQNNWIALMSNMLQMKILGTDNRELLAPTAIDKLLIDTNAHLASINSGKKDNELEVLQDKSRDTITCGGVQISGITLNAIPRRKAPREPIVEAYKFIPCTDGAATCLRDIVTLSAHIAVENQIGIKAKTVELFDDTNAISADELLSPWIFQSVHGSGRIQPDVNVITKRDDVDHETLPANVVVIHPNELVKSTDVLLAVGRRLLTNEQIDNWNLLFDSLQPGGFVLTRENDVKNLGDVARSKGVHIVLLKKYEGEWFVLLRKREKLLRNPVVVHISNEQFDWLDTMHKGMAETLENNAADNPRILFVAQEGFDNGLMGFINCLRRESGGEFVRGIFIQDTKAPPFSLENPLYAEQLQKDLAINVLRENGVWGTYRHMPLPPATQRSVQHKYVEQLVRGDLDSLTWVEGPLDPELNRENLVHVVYASLNWRDIMLASGELAVENVAKTRLMRGFALGSEFSGVNKSGDRVMGFTANSALSNLCIADRACIWHVPHSWGLEDAATVPYAYATCIYALYIKGNMKKGDKVLIHAGSDCVGQAAIHLALAEGCEVFTTVDTPEKRQFILDHFPQIDDGHIGDSRSSSFVDMIARKTNNRGVDVVLNSLSGKECIASVNCVALGGRFLQIGKLESTANIALGMKCVLREISFYRIMMDWVSDESPETKLELQKLLYGYLKNGVVKPLVRTVFAENQIEEAFRYIGSNRHVGKVIIRVGNEESPIDRSALALPQYFCRSDKSYILLGGLGGFGLELADWLVLRGAKNLILTSRKGVTSGYQKMRIELWQSYGVNVTVIAGKDASSYEDCQFLLQTAEKLAPIDGIFNLALVLDDSFWENQTAHSFEESFKPKARATKNLDVLSRKLCPELRHFVAFSSGACGRGNMGQCNYGMSCSVMERICERRVAEGLPGLAIQWNAIGDVGVVADIEEDNEELAFGGTVRQRLSSCLQKLEQFLLQDQPVVCSMLLPENSFKKDSSLDIVESVLQIMGLKNLKGVCANTTLAELGMDSAMCVEIGQTLQCQFNIFRNISEIRALTFPDLEAMMDEDAVEDEQSKEDRMKAVVEANSLERLKVFARLYGGRIQASYEKYPKLRTNNNLDEDEIFVIPGIEGVAAVFDELAPKIDAPATCLQSGMSLLDSITSIADDFLPGVLERCGDRRTFKIVGYSFGSLIAIELARRLEARGLNGQLILIDGAPDYTKAIVTQGKPTSDTDTVQNRSLAMGLNVVAPSDQDKLSAALKKCSTWEEKVNALNDIIPHSMFDVSFEIYKLLWDVGLQRQIAIINYDVSHLQPIEAPITLVKPSIALVKFDQEDYNLSKVTKKPVKIHYVSGNHFTMLDDDKVALLINTVNLHDTELKYNDEIEHSRNL